VVRATAEKIQDDRAVSNHCTITACGFLAYRDKTLVAIKNQRLFPLTLPNVARNVIAHELGHAIGLGHNDDPTTLMCGRPAPCRPGLFAAEGAKYFPLSEVDKGNLRRMYPSTWRAAQQSL
jgi:hypothetical protein